jgi:hypothetical protein
MGGRGSTPTGLVAPLGWNTTVPKSNRNPLANFMPTEVGISSLSANASNAQFVKHSMASAVAQSTTKVKPVVSGLFIGNSNVSISSQFLPTRQPTQTLAAKMVAANIPTPVTMASPTSVAEPFPVVRPEQMRTLKPAVAIHVDPKIQTIPQGDNAIANIPSELQRLFGYQPLPQPLAVETRVAKTTVTKTNPVLALSQLVSPTATTATATGTSLQLATAQAYYTSPPKFDLPGASIMTPHMTSQLQAFKPTQSTSSVFTSNSVQKDLTTAVVDRKSDYVSLMSDKHLSLIHI